MTHHSRREDGCCWDAVLAAGLVLCLLPEVAGASSLSLDWGPVVLGRTESVGVTLRVEEPPGAEERPLRLSVNVGSFGPVTREYAVELVAPAEAPSEGVLELLAEVERPDGHVVSGAARLTVEPARIPRSETAHP